MGQRRPRRGTLVKTRPIAIALFAVLVGSAGAQGLGLGDEFQVNSLPVGRQMYGAVSGDESGAFVVVWGSYTGFPSFWDVRARRFDSAGTPVGTEFVVNSATG